MKYIGDVCICLDCKRTGEVHRVFKLKIYYLELTQLSAEYYADKYFEKEET